jgi:hypothetical protein
MRLLPETRERVTKVFRGEADTVPILAQINEHVVTLCNGNMRETYSDAKKLVEMNLAVFEYYRLDMPGFYYDLYNIEKIGNVASMGYWGYSYLYPHPEKFVKMLDLMASVSPGGLMCMDPDVAETGPEPYAKYAREKKVPLGRLPIEDRPLESFRPPETESFASFMARYRTM